jgi:hypothetical protein
VDAGFLKWTARRTIVRTGRALARGEYDVLAAYVPVSVTRSRNNSVGS